MTIVSQDALRLDAQIKKLADFIMAEVPGEPSQSEGAIDTAIRIIRTQQDLLRARDKGVQRLIELSHFILAEMPGEAEKHPCGENVFESAMRIMRELLARVLELEAEIDARTDPANVVGTMSWAKREMELAKAKERGDQ